MKKQIAELPQKPGVYLFRDLKNRVIYVGKAKDLKKRVSSYFRKKNNLAPDKKQMLAKIKKIEHIVVTDETEALFLEYSLIKKHRPDYNLIGKDDKSHAYIALTREEFPRIFILREKEKEKFSGRLFGPYLSSFAAKQALKILRKIFPYRSCKNLPKRDCLFYHIELCPAPCVRKIKQKDYQEIVKSIQEFLQGKHKKIARETKKKMLKASQNQNYEKAAFYRNRLSALEKIQAMSQKGIKKFLQNIQGGALNLYQKTSGAKLKGDLELFGIPYRIEAYDVSNIQGQAATGSMVVFQSGKPLKSDYRRFRIKTVKGANDVAMIQEVLERRFRKQRGGWPKPDLIVIDGGKAQLNAALSVIQKHNLKIPIRALAKKLEEIYFPKKKKPITLPDDSRSLMLLKQIRDEAHRFAITYHRKLRKKATIASKLDQIPGIGPKRKQALLKKFGSIENIKKAKRFELEKVLNKKIAQRLKNRLKKPTAY